jgi:hypothetical protein
MLERKFLKRLERIPEEMDLAELLHQWKITTDLVPALKELGAEVPADLTDLEPLDIEEFILENDLNKIQGNRLRKGYNAMVQSVAVATASSMMLAAGETKVSSPVSSTATIMHWLAQNGVNVRSDLSTVFSELCVQSVADLAALGKEEQEQVVQALKKNNQKKWVKVDMPGKLEAYALAAEAACAQHITAANQQSTVGEWLAALCLSGIGAKEWLDGEAYEDEDELEDLLGLEESDVELVAAALEKGGVEDGKKVKTALERLTQRAATAVMMVAAVRVPEDCKTLQEAVERGHGGDRLTTIVVGKGEHQIDGSFLGIFSAMNILGDPGVPKSEIVVVGGVKFVKGIPGNCHLQHLVLRQAKGSGVQGQSSFTMEDVIVEQCMYRGVGAYGAGVVGRCTNVEVRQCGCSGVLASEGGSITLIGAKTVVHHNCTKGNNDGDEYGLKVEDSSSSTIQLVSPLTKKHVSIDNGGGGNWGAEDGGDIHQIKTISQFIIKSSKNSYHR